ncbi:unnamed protein product [Somion occarium]|uniref:C2H2-type domain-containing protein n=1 Tax=Somion occarium TaxID=3059160 RepID=A0ABP1CZX0_9APHY
MPSQSAFFDEHAQHSALPTGHRYGSYPQYFSASPLNHAMGAGVHSSFLSHNWRSPPQTAANTFSESPLSTPYSETGSADSSYYMGDVASHAVGYPESSQRTHLPDAAYAAAIYQSRFHGGVSSVDDTTSYNSQGVANGRHALHSASCQFISSSEGSELPVSARHDAHNNPSTTSTTVQQFSPQRLMGMTGPGFSPQTGNFESTHSPPSSIQRSIPTSPQSQPLSYFYPDTRDLHYPPPLSIYPNSHSNAIARLGEPGSPSVVPPLVFDVDIGDEYEEGSECSLPSASSDTSRSSDRDMPSSIRDGAGGRGLSDEWQQSGRDSDAQHGDTGSPIEYDAQSPTLSSSTLASPTLSNENHEHGKSSKKSKMHQCNICAKWFPRPSGLATHMNSHSGARPYKCPVEGCAKSFAVRSNAKRHLRTHGIFPTTEHSAPPTQFTVGFDEPIVSDAPQVGKLPSKLRWVPQSLSSRTNVDHLKDPTSDSEDEYASACAVVSVPLPAVLPSSPKWDGDDRYEERNSYERFGMNPYLSSQWRGLPGPAILSSTL